jgi:nitrite reductase (NADH) large subunit
LNYIIIGNGTAGTTAASKIRNLDINADIKIFSFEKQPYYARPRLSEIIEGKSDLKKIIVFKEQWYEKNNINLYINKKIVNIYANNKTILTIDNEKYYYDKLLLAVGAKAGKINIKGIDKYKVFSLRTIEDALEIKNQISECKEIIIIGGGLLGLELANSIVSNNLIIKIIEVNQCLLNKQLDNIKGKKLQSLLEKKGFVFYLCEICEEIYKENNRMIVKTKSGNYIDGDIIIVTAGISPRHELAKKSGILTGKGVIVDKYLMTSNKDIYSAGDCIEFNGKIWGFVKASLEQGNIAGENMVNNNKKEYCGTEIDAILKINDINLSNL